MKIHKYGRKKCPPDGVSEGLYVGMVLWDQGRRITRWSVGSDILRRLYGYQLGHHQNGGVP